MKPFGLLSKCSLVLLFLAFADTALAECTWPSFDAVCKAFLDNGAVSVCPGTVSTAGCEGKECLGKNFGNEVTLVPGGEYATIWIARTDGEFFTPSYAMWPCEVSSNRGASILELPPYEDHAGCVIGLMTEEHEYAEFFANNTESECFGFVECSCD